MATAVASPEKMGRVQTAIDKRSQVHSLYKKKDGTMTARGKDGVRREVVPFVTAGGTIGWLAHEHTDSHVATAYPIAKVNTRVGRILAQEIARRIAIGEMDVHSDYRTWSSEADLVKKAVTLGYGLRTGHSSNHENFRIEDYPQYRELGPQPSRRRNRIQAMSRGLSEPADSLVAAPHG